jgi:hypothetical protein
VKGHRPSTSYNHMAAHLFISSSHQSCHCISSTLAVKAVKQNQPEPSPINELHPLKGFVI